MVLARVVGIEGRSANIGCVANVLDADRFVILLQDQGHQCFVQYCSTAGDAAIYRSFCHFSPRSRSDREVCSIRDIVAGIVRENHFGLSVSYRTCRPAFQRQETEKLTCAYTPIALTTRT